MKCFHFTNGERRSEDGEDDTVSSSSKARVSWARSLSIASSSTSMTPQPVKFAGLSLAAIPSLPAIHRGFSLSLLRTEEFDFEYDDPSNSKIHVAVKQLNRHGVIKHPNLVKLVGYCAEDDERGMQRLLVYELMKNKSLEDHLMGRVSSPLSWMTRLKIAQDAARGLAYLHEEMDFQLIFRDFKTSNVLLDEEFNAKLSDFGLARLGPAEGYSHVSTSSDVWSFGVVLYELITGRRAVERNLPRNEQKLLEWVRPFVSDSKKFHLIVDSRLEGQYCKKSAQRLASLANKCLAKHPKARPKMSDVVEVLSSIIDEASSQEETESKSEKVAEDESEELDTETEPTKPGNNYLRKVRDIKEMVSLRNKSIGKLDWRNRTPGLVKTL
ncbi:Serine/threonine-protein kinase PCRK1 [Bienertia sinuspersici]